MTAHTFPSSEPTEPPAAPQTLSPRPASRRVTDATTRMLHWLMALSFTGAYLTADGDRWQRVHVTLGYTLAGLLVFRVLWGWVGQELTPSDLARLTRLARQLGSGADLRGRLEQLLTAAEIDALLDRDVAVGVAPGDEAPQVHVWGLPGLDKALGHQ